MVRVGDTRRGGGDWFCGLPLGESVDAAVDAFEVSGSLVSWISARSRCAVGCVRRRSMAVRGLGRLMRRGGSRSGAEEPGAAPGQRDPQVGRSFLRGGARPPVDQVIAYIDAHRDEFGVEPICRVLQVAPSTYYAARTRPPSGPRSLAPREVSTCSSRRPPPPWSTWTTHSRTTAEI